MINLSSFYLTKHGNLYMKIIDKAICENRKKLSKKDSEYIYYEYHHILPKSIFKEYKDLNKFPSNGVLLTAREHFICHALLVQHYRKLNLKSEWHKMSLALSKLKCNNKYYNSKLYESIRKNYNHSEKTKKNISLSAIKKSPIVYLYKLDVLVEKTTILEASKKYFAYIKKTSPEKPYGFKGGINNRNKLRNKNLEEYFGFYISKNKLDKKELLKIKENFNKEINKDYRTIYVYKLNSLVEEIDYFDFIQKYNSTIRKSSINNIVGSSVESQNNLKKSGNESFIGYWISESYIKNPNIDVENFGKKYSEKKRTFNIYRNNKLIYKNISIPSINKKLNTIKFALHKTSKEKPLGYGHRKQTSWLIKNNLLEKYKGYWMEEN